MKLPKSHIEWVAFLTGLILMATMNPNANGHSLCFFDFIGFKYCLGEGLGHSIAFLFRGELKLALEANIMGPVAVVVLGGRIIHQWNELFIKQSKSITGTQNV